MVGEILYIISVLLQIGIIPVAVLIYKRKINFISGVFLGTFLFVASFCVSVYSANIMYGYSWLDVMVNGVFEELISTSKAIYSGSELASVQQMLNRTRDIYFILLPSVVVTSNLVCAYFVLMLAKGLLALFKKDTSAFGRFCDFKMSKTGLMLGLVSSILSGFAGNSRIEYAFLNFTVIILFTTVVCGLSVVDFKFRKKIRSSIVRFIIYMFAFLSAIAIFGLGALMIIGILDAFFDLRKPKSQINNQ